MAANFSHSRRWRALGPSTVYSPIAAPVTSDRACPQPRGSTKSASSLRTSLLPLFCSITSSAWLSALALAIPFTALVSLIAAVVAGNFARTRHEPRADWAYIVLLALLAIELALYAANFGSYGCDAP